MKILRVGIRLRIRSLYVRFFPSGRQFSWTPASIVLAYCMENCVVVKSRTTARCQGLDAGCQVAGRRR